jgi:hypothetical protein
MVDSCWRSGQEAGNVFSFDCVLGFKVVLGSFLLSSGHLSQFIAELRQSGVHWLMRGLRVGRLMYANAFKKGGNELVTLACFRAHSM